jgi:hypothetical protein
LNPLILSKLNSQFISHTQSRYRFRSQNLFKIENKASYL